MSNIKWNSQEHKRFQFPQWNWNPPSDVVVIQVQTDEALQVSKLIWDSSMNVVFVKFPTHLVAREYKKINNQYKTRLKY